MNKMNNSSPKITKTPSQRFWQCFWLTFLVVSLAYAWYSFYAPSNDIKWANNITSVEELTKGTNKKILLFFTGKWCSPCRIMKREVFADKEVTKVINSQAKAAIIDIDNPDSKELVAHFEVGVTPTTIILDAEGAVIHYITGKIEKKKFLEIFHTFKSTIN